MNILKIKIMKAQTTIKIIGLVIVILFILAIPKEKEKPLNFDSSFLIEAEKFEHLIEFKNETK
jgi:hypothetical protein